MGNIYISLYLLILQAGHTVIILWVDLIKIKEKEI